MRVTFKHKPNDICNLIRDGGKKTEVEVVSVHFQIFRDGKKWIQYCVLPTKRRTMQPEFVYEDELEGL